MRGSLPPFFSRSMSSLPSSIMVRSAVKLVSNTLSKPSIRRAVVIWPVTMAPGSKPNSSPRATRTEGATWTMTCLELSWMARHTGAVESSSTMAPTGQAREHWPHSTQSVSPMGRSKAVVTLNPADRPE